MPLNFAAIGADNGYGEATWTHRDAIVYALGVGASQDDPLAELQYTTENSIGVTQQVLPAFGVVLGMTYARRPQLGDRRDGHLRLRARRGRFGGDPQPAQDWAAPEREPDTERHSHVRPDQALLYRMSGDRNPLHSDPVFAAKGGFDRPILHGMCAYGITSRLLINALCDGDPARVRSMSGRFTRPVLPGETLTVRIWADGDNAQFQTADSSGRVVIDRGTFGYARQP